MGRAVASSDLSGEARMSHRHTPTFNLALHLRLRQSEIARADLGQLRSAPEKWGLAYMINTHDVPGRRSASAGAAVGSLMRTYRLSGFSSAVGLGAVGVR